MYLEFGVVKKIFYNNQSLSVYGSAENIADTISETFFGK